MKNLILLLVCLALVSPVSLLSEDYLFFRQNFPGGGNVVDIVRVDLNTGKVFNLDSNSTLGSHNFAGLAVDSVRKKLYWIPTISSDEIYRSNFDGTEVEIFLNPEPNLEDFTALTVDSVRGYVYFVIGSDIIGRQSVDSSSDQDIEYIDPIAENLMEITCDELTGSLYIGTDTSLVRLDLDNTETLLESFTDKTPQGITYDPIGQTVYISFVDSTNAKTIFFP